MGIYNRKYTWIQMINDYPNDIYIRLIVPELQKEFLSRNNISNTFTALTSQEKKLYEEFLDTICEGIAVATDYVNQIVAHRDFGRRPKKELLNLFEKAYDEYVTIFYNAVVGTNS